MIPSFCSIVAVSLSFAARSAGQNALSLSPAAKASSANVSSALDPSFAGFGIEPSNLFSFTGGSSANDFSVNLLQNLADYSGAPPHIRVGGNTGDYMIWDDSYNDYSLQNNPNAKGTGVYKSDSLIFGPGYLKALDRFPKDTPITYGLNLAYSESDYIDNIVKEAKAVVGGLTNVKLYSFEIGNEPDLYLQNSFRSGSWDGAEYVKEYLERASAVYSQVLQPAGISSLFFEGPATASTIGTTFEITDLVTDGLTATTNGSKYISAWNEHDYFYFIGVSNVPLTLDDLMNLDNTNSQFAYWETQVAAGLKTGLPYVLREMSSVGPIGMHGVSDAFGASLWTLNFFLYLASLNVSMVGMHMTDNSNASAWQPIEMYGNQAFVRPQYYAHAAMAQIIGNGNGTTQIGVLDTSNAPSSYSGRIRAFTSYANGNLASVILINSLQSNASDSSKGSFTFDLSLGSSYASQTLYLSYLTADGADSLSGTTFNGISFEENSDGTPKTVNSTAQTVSIGKDGKVSVTVRDSQAVVANIGSQLGSNAVLTSNSTGKPGSSGKKSTAGPSATGSATAIIGGAVTTTLAAVSSLASDGAHASATGTTRGTAGGRSSGRKGLMVVMCLMAVMVGFVWLA